LGAPGRKEGETPKKESLFFQGGKRRGHGDVDRTGRKRLKKGKKGKEGSSLLNLLGNEKKKKRRGGRIYHTKEKRGGMECVLSFSLSRKRGKKMGSGKGEETWRRGRGGVFLSGGGGGGTLEKKRKEKKKTSSSSPLLISDKKKKKKALSLSCALSRERGETRIGKRGGGPFSSLRPGKKGKEKSRGLRPFGEKKKWGTGKEEGGTGVNHFVEWSQKGTSTGEKLGLKKRGKLSLGPARKKGRKHKKKRKRGRCAPI